MAIAPSKLLTYEAYLAEEPINQRYDILDGVRIFMANPTRQHQNILGNIFEGFRAYERRSRLGKAYMAPCDVLIRRNPLRTRQPDVLFITHRQLAQCDPDTEPAPLLAAPELIVEILSPSETRRTRSDKIEDYRRVGVQERWVVYPDTETVEVLRLTAVGVETVATYGPADTVQSAPFLDLTIPVADIFAL